MNRINETPTERSERIGCYCSLWDKDPQFYVKENVPEGYCGICDNCKKPGHTRHYPGPVPYTGSWCDSCYLKEGKRYKTKSSFFILIILLTIGFTIWKIFL